MILLGLFSAAYAASASVAGTIHPDLISRLNTLPSQEEIPVIVTLTDQLDLKQFKGMNKKSRRVNMNKALRAKAEKSQQPLVAFLKKQNARKIKRFWIFNGMAVTLPVNQINALANRPEVESVRLDNVLSVPEPSPSQAVAPEWNLNAINAPALWELGYTGEGVVIASMDTGVDIDHSDIGPKWRGGNISWHDIHAETTIPYDSSSGHGTATMGIMVGGDSGGTSIGVAPGAQWIAVKLFSDSEPTFDSHIFAGFEWLLDPDGDPNTTNDMPDVLNNSWGYDSLVNQCYSPEEENPYRLSMQALRAADVALVFSAGNTGPNPTTSISPANFPESFAVGAVDQTLTIADFSARGPSSCDGAIFPELVAPGRGIRTADLTLLSENSYVTVEGTSFSAPHVSGAMALLLSVDPGLTVDELETLLKMSALDLGSLQEDNIYGYGMLDVEAAYNLHVNPPPYTIYATAGTNGIISPVGEVSVDTYGGSQEFSMVPAPLYHVEDILVDGGSVGSGDTYTFDHVTSDHTIHVTFSNSYTLSVDITGSGRGSIISDPPGISCPDDCESDYIDGTVVTLTAEPDNESTFTGWSGGCADQGANCVVTIDQAQDVSAGFYSFPWELFISIFTVQQKQ